MKPGFALSLSSDGITLLHRAGSGWRNIGQVTFDSDDLEADLADLRRRGDSYSDLDPHCKLIIPNDQIRYLTIETGKVPFAERMEAARAGLEGATPYAVSDLAFDISEEGTQTHIAAVALETLDEAETFATSHGFLPASFVAIPGDAAFLGEPFFGLAKSFGKGKVVPDGIVVTDIGPADGHTPKTVPAAPPAPAPTAGSAQYDERRAKANSTTENDVKPAPKITLTAVRELGEEGSGRPETSPDPARNKGRRAQDKVERSDSEANNSSEVDGPIQGFSSRRRQTDLPPSSTPKIATPNKDKSAAPIIAAPPISPVQKGTPTTKVSTGSEDLLNTIKGDASFASNKAAPSKTPPTKTPSAGPLAKPHKTGLILTAGLIVLMLAIGAFAYVGKVGPFAERSGVDLLPPASQPTDDAAEAQTPPALPPVAAPELQEGDAPIAPQVSALSGQPDPGVSELEGAAPANENAPTDPAVLADGVTDAQPLPLETAPPQSEQNTSGADPSLPSEAELAAQYAATGIWQSLPALNRSPALPDLNDLYVASVDAGVFSHDAVALPMPAAVNPDTAPDVVAAPPPADRAFVLDERGLVVATPEGTLNPDGVMVFLGRPTKVPPATPARPDPQEQAATEEAERRAALSQKRPRTRPGDFAERIERAQLGGFSREELASLRPKLRPQSLKTAEQESQPVSELAVLVSASPRQRPANFANLVDRAQRNSQNAPQVTAVAAPAAAPRIPSSASVARRATITNAINLRQMNLIGVSGTAADRRALVRLANGRIRRVKVGDRLDGGQVIAIGEARLQYQKRGRNHTLDMPK